MVNFIKLQLNSCPCIIVDSSLWQFLSLFVMCNVSLRATFVTELATMDSADLRAIQLPHNVAKALID